MNNDSPSPCRWAQPIPAATPCQGLPKAKQKTPSVNFWTLFTQNMKFYRPLSKVFKGSGRKVRQVGFAIGNILMKTEKNHEFRSSGVLLILGLLVFCIAIIATPWNRQMQDSRVETALQKAEVVGYQVVQIYREAAKNTPSKEMKGSRIPASVADSAGSEELLRLTGTMGMDPWGRPYRYRILTPAKESSEKVRILVWSTGPNLKVDTKNLDDESQALTEQPLYSGDDIGVVLGIN